jgi:hypothetical protein
MELLESQMDSIKKMASAVRQENAELQNMIVSLQTYTRSLHKLILSGDGLNQEKEMKQESELENNREMNDNEDMVDPEPEPEIEMPPVEIDTNPVDPPPPPPVGEGL